MSPVGDSEIGDCSEGGSCHAEHDDDVLDASEPCVLDVLLYLCG